MPMQTTATGDGAAAVVMMEGRDYGSRTLFFSIFCEARREAKKKVEFSR